MKTTTITRVLAIMMAAFALGACATITEGGDQTTLIDSKPRGAACDLTRESELIAHVDKTPESVHLEKATADIIVKCTKDDMTGNAVLSSEFAGATAGNILLGGIIGIGVDAMSGALNKYPESIIVEMGAASEE